MEMFFAYALPIVTFCVMWTVWYLHGRDPKGRGTIVAEYQGPTGLGPAEMEAILNGAFTNRAFVGTLLDLARRGYVSLDFGLEGSRSMFLDKRKEQDDQLSFFEKKLMEIVFANGSRRDLRDKDDSLVRFIIYVAPTLVFHELHQKGLYSEQPILQMLTWTFMAGLVLFVFSTFDGPIETGGFVSGLIIWVFALVMPRTTVRGARVREEVAGFRRFLKVAEASRLEFHHAPHTRPEEFDRHLPYAVALGAETEWMKYVGGAYIFIQSSDTKKRRRHVFESLLESQRILTEAKKAGNP